MAGGGVIGNNRILRNRITLKISKIKMYSFRITYIITDQLKIVYNNTSLKMSFLKKDLL